MPWLYHSFLKSYLPRRSTSFRIYPGAVEILDRIDTFEVEDASVTASLDGGAPTGAHTRAEVFEERWEVSRTCRFGS